MNQLAKVTAKAVVNREKIMMVTGAPCAMLGMMGMLEPAFISAVVCGTVSTALYAVAFKLGEV